MKTTFKLESTDKHLLIVFLLLMFSCVAQKKITNNDLLSVTQQNLVEIDSLNKIYIYTYDKVNTPEVISLKEFGKLIWNRKKNGEITFNKKNFNTITKEYIKGNDKYFSSLEIYQAYIILIYDNNHQNYLSFAERAYIAGHITDFLYQCQNKANIPVNTTFARRFTYSRKNQRNRYNREFKNYNFYDLKFLKKYYLQEYSRDSEDRFYQKYIKREELTKNPTATF